MLNRRFKWNDRVEVKSGYDPGITRVSKSDNWRFEIGTSGDQYAPVRNERKITQFIFQ